LTLLRPAAGFLSVVGAALLLLYLWIRYFSPAFPAEVFGLLAVLAGGVGGYLGLMEYFPRRFRTPARLLRWNAFLAALSLAHVLAWGFLSTLPSPDEERLLALLKGLVEVGIAAQVSLQAALVAHLTLTRFHSHKRVAVAVFFGLAALNLLLRLIAPAWAVYLAPLLWVAILPILYFSQGLLEAAAQQPREVLLLVTLSLLSLFFSWQVLPELFLGQGVPLYEGLSPILWAFILLHGGWLILPALVKLAQVGRGEAGSLELLTAFLARQQRSTSAEEVLRTSADWLAHLPSVAGVLLELRSPLEQTHRVSFLISDALAETLRQLLTRTNPPEGKIEVLPTLQRYHGRLPDKAAILVWQPVALLHGAMLYQTLHVAVLGKGRDSFEERDVRLITTVVEQTALFLENLERRAYHEQLLTARKEADFLRETREALLPPPSPILSTVDYHVLFEQYDRTIGGDYYQIYDLPGGKWVDFWLSDSAGSGISAAYQMAQARAALNTLWLQPLPPEGLILQLNDALKRVFHKNNFLAATLLRFDFEQKEYVLYRAGTPEVFYWNPLTETAELLRPSGIVLGNASSQIIRRILVPEKGRLLPGSLFMLFSDGFTEATNPQGEMFGTERLFALFSAYHRLPVEDLAYRILEAVHEFTGSSSLGDDGTLLVIRYTG